MVTMILEDSEARRISGGSRVESGNRAGLAPRYSARAVIGPYLSSYWHLPAAPRVRSSEMSCGFLLMLVLMAFFSTVALCRLSSNASISCTKAHGFLSHALDVSCDDDHLE